MGSSPPVLVLWCLCFILLGVGGAYGADVSTTGGNARIQVVLIDSQGVERPMGGATIQLTEFVVIPPMRGGSGRPEKVRTFEVRADEHGVAEVQLSSAAGVPRISGTVVRGGATFSSGLVDPRSGEAKIIVYALAPAQTDLAAVMWCRVRVLEAVVLVECVVRLSVRGNRAVRLSRDGPRIPFLALEVAEDFFLDHTFTKKGFDHFKADSDSSGIRILPDGRGVVLEGVVVPGTPAQVRVRYPIVHQGEETPLGFVAPFDISIFTLHVESTENYPATVTVSQPGERATSTRDGHIIQQYRSRGALRAGEIIKVRLGNLPHYNPWWLRFMTLAMLMILTTVVLVWLRLRSEERDGD